MHLRGRMLAALVLGLALPAAALGAEPDLVADPPENPALSTDVAPGGQTRLLLRFDGFVHNQGAGPLEMDGNNPVNGVMSVTQQIAGFGAYTPPPGAPQPRISFETADGHYHWHLAHAARYSLWNADRTGEVAPAMKVGFCLEDVDPVSPSAPPRRYMDFCQQGHPDASSVTMGVSAGWRDVYGSYLTFQWVDVSSTAPGSYWLRGDVDPDGVIKESNEVNPPAYAASPVTVPGYVAQATSASGLVPGQAAPLTLTAARFGSPGRLVFTVVSPPAHGTLSVAPGVPFAGPSVSYTPEAGYAGPDSFSYTARDASNAFPLSSPVAQATLAVSTSPGATVAVSGAPATLLAGTSAQLSALVAAAPGLVTWSVDGVDGGNATVGTISPSGLYTAPAAPPPGGTVHVRARSVWNDGLFGEVAIGVVPAPAPRPAPAVAVAGRQGLLARLSRPALAIHGRYLIAQVLPGKGGTVTIGVRSGRSVVGRCAARSPAGRMVTCRFVVRRHPSKVRAVAKLIRYERQVARTTATIRLR